MTHGSGGPGATCCFHGHVSGKVGALPGKRWVMQRQKFPPRGTVPGLEQTTGLVGSPADVREKARSAASELASVSCENMELAGWTEGSLASWMDEWMDGWVNC